MPTSVAPTPRAASPYLVSGPVDGALIGGVSIAVWAALAWAPARDPAGVVVAVAVLARLCNWPHFAATSYRLYRTREHVRQYPMTALVVPLVVLAGTAWALAAPHDVAPLFVKMVLLWSPYHFSGQTIGVSLVYARRSGFPVTPTTRLALSGVAYSAFAWATARVESGTGMRHYLGIDHPKLGVPGWAVDVAAVALGAFAALLVVELVRTWRRERRVVPAIVLLPLAAQLVWFVGGRDDERFQLLVPFFHSLQYLTVAWAVHLAERAGERRTAFSVRGVVAESARWWSANVVLGIGLFLGLPLACTLFGAELTFAMAVTSAAVQLHHFFVDGVIWKLRNPRVRSPLLVTLPELVRAAPAAAVGSPQAA